MEARGKKWGVTRGARAVAIGAALWLAPSDAAAQAGKTGAAPAPAAAPSAPVIYPAKGQSPEKQQKDKTECNAWATQQTGYDPVAEAQAQLQGQAAPAQKGGAVRGAAKGAAAGAAIGAVAGDAGTGAAVGATAGGVGGGARKKKEAAAQQQAASEQQAAAAQRLAGYQKAFGACMEGRGYTVK